MGFFFAVEEKDKEWKEDNVWNMVENGVYQTSHMNDEGLLIRIKLLR